MNDQIIKDIVEEISPVLTDRRMGKVFQLSRSAIAIDFRLREGLYLFISAEPHEPRMYLIARTVRDLERQTLAPSPFVQMLRKHFAGATLRAITKNEGDRIVRLTFDAHNAVGEEHSMFLIAQLTGRTANLFALDEMGRILARLRPGNGGGQKPGDVYQSPSPTSIRSSLLKPSPFVRGRFSSLSEAADDYYRRLELERSFYARASAHLAQIHKEIDRRRKLQGNLARDLARHGDAEEHKRLGELLLANIATAQRNGRVVRIKDYYAEDAPEIELEIEENSTLQEEASRRFARYSKSKRALQEISRRLGELDKELEQLEHEHLKIEKIIAEKNADALEMLSRGAAEDVRQLESKRKKQGEHISGVRRYRSSDGYEVFVGRGALDNDRLTFRLARPNDLWFHAADYPGAHVVVRNPTRTDIPHRTVVEAAQLAAYFSQAQQDAKVDVHYTHRKFLSKPKGAAPGLVRMSNFRTLIVEPRETLERV